MDGTKAINEKEELNNRLENAKVQMRSWGIDLAEKERTYKIRLMQEVLKLKDEGMPATLINQVVYGIVANERFERDKAEVMYKTSIENVNIIKLQLRLLDNQIQREYGSQ